MNYDLLIYPPREDPCLLAGFPDEKTALREAQRRIGDKIGVVIHLIKRPGFFLTYTSMGKGELVCGSRQITIRATVDGEEITFVDFDHRGLVGAAKFR